MYWSSYVIFGSYFIRVLVHFSTYAQESCCQSSVIIFQCWHPYGDSKVSTSSSISLLRALSGDFCPTSLVSVIQGCQVLITMFNTSVFSFISKQGGTHSLSLLRLAVDLLFWLQAQKIVLRARHILAVFVEWSLLSEIVARGLNSNSGRLSQSATTAFLSSYLRFRSH